MPEIYCKLVFAPLHSQTKQSSSTAKDGRTRKEPPWIRNAGNNSTKIEFVECWDGLEMGKHDAYHYEWFCRFKMWSCDDKWQLLPSLRHSHSDYDVLFANLYLYMSSHNFIEIMNVLATFSFFTFRCSGSTQHKKATKNVFLPFNFEIYILIKPRKVYPAIIIRTKGKKITFKITCNIFIV